MTTQPPGRQTRSISARPASPPWPASGVNAEQATTRSAQSSGTGRSSKNPSRTRARSPRSARRAACGQQVAQRRRGLDRDQLLARAPEQLERQPAGAGAHLDDPLDGLRQPSEHAGMEALGANEPVVELRLEPVQQLPGQGDVGSRIGRRAPAKNVAPPPR